MAGRQWGRLSWAQLRAIGLAKATISEWVSDGYLYRVLPAVYGVGHRAPWFEADLMAAILYAGPGAMLSHATAAWWWRLTNRRPRAIEVSTPRRRRSLPGISVGRQRALERVMFNRMPVTTVAQTLLDVAATESLDTIRYMLAEADYRRRLDVAALRRLMGPGRPGTVMLRRAMDCHNPALAYTRSRVERAFLALCERGGIPRPLINVRVCGFTVDCYWPQYRLVVELDGALGHGTERQVARDHARDLTLRAVGIETRRYAEPQVLQQGDLVLRDVVAGLRLGGFGAEAA